MEAQGGVGQESPLSKDNVKQKTLPEEKQDEGQLQTDPNPEDAIDLARVLGAAKVCGTLSDWNDHDARPSPTSSDDEDEDMTVIMSMPCTQCSKKFPTYKKLQRHMTNHLSLESLDSLDLELELMSQETLDQDYAPLNHPDSGLCSELEAIKDKHKTRQEQTASENKTGAKPLPKVLSKEESMKLRPFFSHLRNETQSIYEESDLPIELSDRSEEDQAISPTDLNVYQSKTEKYNLESIEEVDHGRLKEYTFREDEETWSPDTDMKATFHHNTEVTMRMCPLEDVELLAVKLKSENLCLAGPVVQIEDFHDIYEGCREILIRHNIYNWKKYQNFYIRLYQNLNSSAFVEMPAYVLEDYVKVCGPHIQQTIQGRCGSSKKTAHNPDPYRGRKTNLDDDGYKVGSASPTPTTRYIVIAAEEEDICCVRLYFSRRINNKCSPNRPHDIRVHIVLEMKDKMREFVNMEMPNEDLEKAADTIRLLVHANQVYTPAMGSAGPSSVLVWDYGNPLTSFSYLEVTQRKGFMPLRKVAPSKIKLSCDDYYMAIKLTPMDSHLKPPNDEIYTTGSGLVPWECRPFLGSDSSVQPGTEIAIQPKSPEPPYKATQETEGTATSFVSPTVYLNLPDLQQEGGEGTSFSNVVSVTNQPEDIQYLEVMTSECFLQERKPKKVTFSCDYCEKVLSRKQTYVEHLERYHVGLPVPKILLIQTRGRGPAKKRKEMPSVDSSLNSLSDDYNPLVSPLATASSSNGLFEVEVREPYAKQDKGKGKGKRSKVNNTSHPPLEAISSDIVVSVANNMLSNITVLPTSQIPPIPFTGELKSFDMTNCDSCKEVGFYVCMCDVMAA